MSWRCYAIATKTSGVELGGLGIGLAKPAADWTPLGSLPQQAKLESRLRTHSSLVLVVVPQPERDGGRLQCLPHHAREVSP